MRQTFYTLLTVFLISCATTPERNPWREVTSPTPGPPLVIGSNSCGCLSGAKSLYPDGPGYHVMRLSRRRYYGHPDLIEFLQTLGKQTQRKKLGALLIGDLAQPRGGPTLSGHASHQTGLDVDIWFSQPLQEPLTLDERENLIAPSMIDSSTNQIDETKWGERQIQILKLVSQNGKVDRAFVNPVIKKYLCAKYPSQTWLAKIRPWWGHDDHFHVRLKCPSDQKDCSAKEDPIPPGTGCDQTLEWWFSNEATKKASEKPSPPTLPKLPDACEKIITT